MARTKIDPAVSRKAYAIAEKNLKSLHADQFSLLLDEAYESLGAESPRQRRERAASEKAKARAERAAAKAAKAQAKIDEAIALLKANGIEISTDAA
jgi:hypothetical protein